jgi:hypothetical protein
LYLIRDIKAGSLVKQGPRSEESSFQRLPRLERPHPLLEAAEEDDRPWLENGQFAAEALALLLQVNQGWLAEDDAVDRAADG